MNHHRRKKKAVPISGTVEDATNVDVTAHKSVDGYRFDFPATDGFKVEAKTGKISIIQEPVCCDQQLVNLTIYEARQLLNVLPAAIQAAEVKLG
jgi:hypothetical protein